MHGELTGQNDVSIHNPTDGIPNGIVNIIAVHEDGVDTGDGAARISAWASTLQERR